MRVCEFHCRSVAFQGRPLWNAADNDRRIAISSGLGLDLAAYACILVQGDTRAP